MIIDFKDWKYLSNNQRFSVDITDPEIIKGQKEGSIDIDFSIMQK